MDKNNKNWLLVKPFLYFGCHTYNKDYSNCEELQAYVQDGTLTQLHVAFSHEEEQQQHKRRRTRTRNNNNKDHNDNEQEEEQQKGICTTFIVITGTRNIYEHGAYFYVCGVVYKWDMM